MWQGVLSCVNCFSNTGGSIGTYTTSQWACHWCRWPWRVLSATCTPRGESEVQNYQRQEGHGQRHVSHILPTPGEGGRQKGELDSRRRWPEACGDTGELAGGVGVQEVFRNEEITLAECVKYKFRHGEQGLGTWRQEEIDVLSTRSNNRGKMLTCVAE